MSDGDERLAEQKAREQQREADLVQNRIGELYENPIKGNFDADHLKAVHRYIFQDLPPHQPGIVREDTEDWIKHRTLEGRPAVYNVHYASQGIEAKITNTLAEFGGPDAIKGLTLDAAATRLAELYGDLDHAHGFHEGNSRTLREFARELAEKAGFNLDWTKTGVAAQERNEFYVARDLAVLERAFPGLTEEKAMQTNDRAEYEAYYVMAHLRNAVGDKSLEAIIRQGLSAENQLERGTEHDEGGPAQGFQDLGAAAAGVARLAEGVAEVAEKTIDALNDETLARSSQAAGGETSADDRLQEDLRAAKEGTKSDDAPSKASDRGKGRDR